MRRDRRSERCAEPRTGGCSRRCAELEALSAQNILSVKGHRRNTELNPYVNGSSGDGTHNLGIFSTLLQPSQSQVTAMPCLGWECRVPAREFLCQCSSFLYADIASHTSPWNGHRAELRGWYLTMEQHRCLCRVPFQGEMIKTSPEGSLGPWPKFFRRVPGPVPPAEGRFLRFPSEKNMNSQTFRPGSPLQRELSAHPERQFQHLKERKKKKKHPAQFPVPVWCPRAARGNVSHRLHLLGIASLVQEIINSKRINLVSGRRSAQRNTIFAPGYSHSCNLLSDQELLPKLSNSI
ncbi:uncharacterized protein LOC120754088 isoform X1 [Hirundo rustica]|uniref:uncharacterized protein LOC120754088 isoform X1 n=1 Tax=Hirundo rustica TaxID=43150 RepID=UPI001A94AC8D|nr:uncharacterized protein LOC120754088 isoform X1 [Hirundo rustica]